MAKKFFKHPVIIIALFLLVTCFFAFQLRKIKLDNSLRLYLPVEHESYLRLEQMEDEFGGTEKLSVVVQDKHGTILTAENIDIIKKITDRLSEADHIKDVVSLTNIDFIYDDAGSLSSGELIGGEYRGIPEDLMLIREKLSSWNEMYDRVVISDDLKSTQITVTLDQDLSSAEKQAVLDTVRIVAGEEAPLPNLKLTFVGDPVVGENALLFMKSDLFRLIPLVVLVVLICLFLSFNTLEGTLFPLITVFMATVWSMGIMAMMNITFTIISSVIPVALIAIGSAYGIHVLNHYYADLEKASGEITREQHLDIILGGLKSVLPAVILAGITTIAGFISLVTSPLVPLRSFAVFTALGVFFSLLLSITFIPALLVLKPVKKIGKRSEGFARFKQKFKEKVVPGSAKEMRPDGNKKPFVLHRLYRFMAGSPIRLILTSIIILVISWLGIKRIVVDTALINYFPPGSPMRQDVNFVDEQFAGTNSIYLMVEGQEKGDMTRPEILKPLDDLQEYLAEKYHEVGKVVSFTTFVKRMNQVMHVPEAASYYENLSRDNYDYSGEDFSFSSFGNSLDTFGTFDSFDTFEEPAGNGYIDFLDPNIGYSQELEKTITLKDGLDLLNRAYIMAGGKNASIQSMVNALEREMNYNGIAYYEIPYDTSKYPAEDREDLKDLVTQYLLLFSGSLDSFIDDSLEPGTARVMVQLRTRSTHVIGNIIKDVEEYAAAYFPEGYTLQATGNAELEYTMTNMIISSQMASLLFSLVMVFIILMVYFRSVLAGIIGCVPLFFCILLNYMAMGMFGINLDMFTSLIASIAVGVGIDYTIHFMTNYQVERARSNDLEAVTEGTLKKSGRGIITNALSVGLGFLVLCLSEFVVLRYIGILAMVVMSTSSIMAMTVIPGILNIFNPRFMRRVNKTTPEQHAVPAE